MSCGVAATIRRLAPVLLRDPAAREECACKAAALDSVCEFLSALEKSAAPS
jgi:hypothetical protein